MASSVLLHDLVLDSIFSNFYFTSLKQFRLVCKQWKASIDRIIPNDALVRVRISDVFQKREKWTQIVECFKLFKISNLVLDIQIHYKKDRQVAAERTLIIMQILQEYGPQLKYLFFKTAGKLMEKEWILLKDVLALTPNLQFLRIENHGEIDVPLFYKIFSDQDPMKSVKAFRVFNPEFTNVPMEFIQTILKFFPNLETNFGKEKMDCRLLQMMKETSVPMTLKKFKRQWGKYDGKDFPFLKQVDGNLHPLSKFEIFHISYFNETMAQNLTLILQNFFKTLKVVKLFMHRCYRESFTVTMPPLPKLKKLELEILNCNRKKAFVGWNLGTAIAKDFPLLEYLVIHRQDFVRDKDYEDYSDEEFFKYKLSDDWRCWEPFVPLSENEVELAKFAKMKFVDLSLPCYWIGPEENRDWGKQFLETYFKLYANANYGNVQNIIDWLKP